MSDQWHQYAWMSHWTPATYVPTANPQFNYAAMNNAALYNGSYVSSRPPIQPPLGPNSFGMINPTLGHSYGQIFPYGMEPPARAMVPFGEGNSMDPYLWWMAAGGMFGFPMPVGNIMPLQPPPGGVSFNPNAATQVAASAAGSYRPGLAEAFAMQPNILPRAHFNGPRQSALDPPKIEILDNSPDPTAPPRHVESSQNTQHISPSNPPPQPAPAAADPLRPQMKRLRVDSLDSYTTRAREESAAKRAGDISSGSGTPAAPAPALAAPASALAAPVPAAPAPVFVPAPAPSRRIGKEPMTDMPPPATEAAGKVGVVDMWPAAKGLWIKKWLPNGSSLMSKRKRDEPEGELRPSIKAMALMGRVMKEKQEKPCVLVRKGPVTIWYTKE